MNAKPLLVVTLGDPLSINIEAVADLLMNPPNASDSSSSSTPDMLMIGSYWQWQFQLEQLGLSHRCELQPLVISDLDSYLKTSKEEDTPEHPGARRMVFWDVGICNQDPRTLTSRLRGELATASLNALRSLPEVERLAVLTCPIDKHACSEAGFPFAGQTEFFGDLWQTEPIMVLCGPKLVVGLVTNHVPIKELPQSLSRELIERKITLMAALLRSQSRHADRKVKLGVCGFNPHASDQGLIGSEDLEMVTPAVQSFRDHPWLEVDGPMAADTLFFKCLEGAYDGVLAMYHDQGLGPLKTIHFYDAVNISFGLKHFRVSPDHGPARDLFLTKSANLSSFRQAFLQCIGYLG